LVLISIFSKPPKTGVSSKILFLFSLASSLTNFLALTTFSLASSLTNFLALTTLHSEVSISEKSKETYSLISKVLVYFSSPSTKSRSIFTK